MQNSTPIQTLRASAHELPRCILVEHFMIRAGSDRAIRVQNDRDRLGFFFCLSGQDCLTVKGTKDVVHIRKGVCGAYREVKGLVRSAVYDPAEPFSLVSVTMPPETMVSLFGLSKVPIFSEKKDKYPPYAFSFLPVQPHINTAVAQIINPPVDQSLLPVYMESKALEIITLMLQAMRSSQSGHGFSPSLNSEEVARLCQARELLDEHLQSPPSLEDIARQSGLSRNRLNLGFRELFGRTVYDYLKTGRLEKARALLASGEYNVTEACMNVGYTNLSHFAKMYRKHFGVSPIKDRKRFFPMR